jgi:hypothetical protein
MEMATANKGSALAGGLFAVMLVAPLSALLIQRLGLSPALPYVGATWGACIISAIGAARWPAPSAATHQRRLRVSLVCLLLWHLLSLFADGLPPWTVPLAGALAGVSVGAGMRLGSEHVIRWLKWLPAVLLPLGMSFIIPWQWISGTAAFAALIACVGYLVQRRKKRAL